MFNFLNTYIYLFSGGFFWGGGGGGGGVVFMQSSHVSSFPICMPLQHGA